MSAEWSQAAASAQDMTLACLIVPGHHAWRDTKSNQANMTTKHDRRAGGLKRSPQRRSPGNTGVMFGGDGTQPTALLHTTYPPGFQQATKRHPSSFTASGFPRPIPAALGTAAAITLPWHHQISSDLSQNHLFHGKRLESKFF